MRALTDLLCWPLRAYRMDSTWLGKRGSGDTVGPHNDSLPIRFNQLQHSNRIVTARYLRIYPASRALCRLMWPWNRRHSWRIPQAMALCECDLH